jgi:hypothetical protein
MNQQAYCGKQQPAKEPEQNYNYRYPQKNPHVFIQTILG